MLSVSTCRTILPFPAPRASRTAISRPRVEARASSRFAMLAHAISITNATAPSSRSRPGLMSPTTSECSVATVKRTSRFHSGYCAARRAARSLAAAADCSSERPGSSRAIDCRITAPRDGFARSSRRGRHNCASATRPGRKLAGMTPITSCASPPSVMIRPMTAGSPPKRRSHKEWPSTTTRAAFGTSSAGWKSRPSCGGMPSTEKYWCVTISPGSGSGSPLPVRTACQPWMAVTPAKMPLACQSAMLPGVAHSCAGPPRPRRSCHTMTSRPESG